MSREAIEGVPGFVEEIEAAEDVEAVSRFMRGQWGHRTGACATKRLSLDYIEALFARCQKATLSLIKGYKPAVRFI